MELSYIICMWSCLAASPSPCLVGVARRRKILLQTRPFVLKSSSIPREVLGKLGFLRRCFLEGGGVCICIPRGGGGGRKCWWLQVDPRMWDGGRAARRSQAHGRNAGGQQNLVRILYFTFLQFLNFTVLRRQLYIIMNVSFSLLLATT